MGPPKPPMPHVAPVYRLTATALGAGMWFWVRRDCRSWLGFLLTGILPVVDVQSKERR